jgi:hypothetical protein
LHKNATLGNDGYKRKDRRDVAEPPAHQEALGPSHLGVVAELTDLHESGGNPPVEIQHDWEREIGKEEYEHTTGIVAFVDKNDI